jgi:hypothetical protein
VLTGYGFYGGSEFEPWTDSGLARTFLSVGFPLGVALYINYFLIVKLITRLTPLVLVALAVLCVGELKEPILYSGYAFRAFLLLLLVLRYDDMRAKLN